MSGGFSARPPRIGLSWVRGPIMTIELRVPMTLMVFVDVYIYIYMYIYMYIYIHHIHVNLSLSLCLCLCERLCVAGDILIPQTSTLKNPSLKPMP